MSGGRHERERRMSGLPDDATMTALSDESGFQRNAVAFAIGQFGNVPDAMAYLAELAQEMDEQAGPVS